MPISGWLEEIFNKPKLDKAPWRSGRWKKGSIVPASRSKYKRRQGEREKARRVAQIARGVIRP